MLYGPPPLLGAPHQVVIESGVQILAKSGGMDTYCIPLYFFYSRYVISCLIIFTPF